MRFPLLIFLHICFPDMYRRAPIASCSSPGTSTAPPRLLTWVTRSATLDRWENEQSQPSHVHPRSAVERPPTADWAPLTEHNGGQRWRGDSAHAGVPPIDSAQ